MYKHAFLILAHNEPAVFKALLSQLDDERNDVFVHLDKKANIEDFKYEMHNANLYFIERTSVKWGDYSQTNATIVLLKEAVRKNKYKYYHLLGGTTLCTKSQEIIHNFYDNTDLEYFHINKLTFSSIQSRCKYYYPFINLNCFRKSKMLKGLSLILGKSQSIVGINRLRKSPLKPIYNGMEWFSITDDFARYVLDNEKLIRKTFKYTLASEEVFIQTICMHSEFKSRAYGYNGKDDFIDASKTFQFWNNGKSTLIDSVNKAEIALNDPNSFFARKIISKNNDVIEYIKANNASHYLKY